jgi:hypothetical protein
MKNSADHRYSDAELEAEFGRLFPHGLAGADVLAELAPQGWGNSPLLAINHPSLDRCFQEAVQSHRNLCSLLRPEDKKLPSAEPTLDEVAARYKETPIEIERETRELVGQCLWDVFSDSHEVMAADGRVLDLGSFRGTGGFLADLLNRQIGTRHYDYIDFYMGTIWVSQRADLTPVYAMIFRRLKSRRFDWVYRFPQLYAIDMRPLKAALDDRNEPDWLNYSPSEALAKEQQEQDRDRELGELRESLDESHREAVDEALRLPPPPTVRAYEIVYGQFPAGWSPIP